jgi:hypothetical protein
MKANMHKILVTLVVCTLMGPAQAFADSQTARLGDWQPEKSSYRQAAPAPAVPQQQAKKRSWPGRHPVLFGTLVGLGAGLVIEAIVIPGESGGEPHSAYIPMFATVGAGTGALVGYIISANR